MEYFILLLALAGIVLGADNLVSGSVAIAKRYKVSDFVIGAAIVGIGTSMPELAVSMIGAIDGNPDVAIGNVVGSNIFNVFGILGLTALFFPVAIRKANMRFELPVCIGISLLLTVLVFNIYDGSSPEISRLDGWVLLLCFAFYMWYSFYRDSRDGCQQPADAEQGAEEKLSPLWLALLRVVGGLTVLVVSCDIFVENAVSVARSFGVDDAFISLTLIACGTSLPELAASVAAAFKKNTQLALGNIIGSNIFNIALILGLCSQIKSLNSSGITTVDYIVMIAAAVIPLLLGFMGKINRWAGAFMFVCFVAYTWYLLNSQIA